MERIINITRTSNDKKSAMYEKQMFTHIFNLYYKRIYNYTYYRVNNNEQAEDLTSMVFEKVIKKISTYSENKADFEIWIFTIARNTINDFFRKQKRRKIVCIDSIFNMVSGEKGPEDIKIDPEDKDYKKNKLIVNYLDKINEVDAVLSAGRDVDWISDGVLYAIMGKKLSTDEVIKIAESIK